MKMDVKKGGLSPPFYLLTYLLNRLLSYSLNYLPI